MREIKFRAWDMQEKRMRPSFSLSEYMSITEAASEKYTPLMTANTLMQYTGLKDKNWKEIYEGDVVESSNWTKYEVRWNNRTSSFQIWQNGKYNRKFRAIGKIEIIWNIYENPNLLNND